MYSLTGSFSAYSSASDEVQSAYLATAEVMYQYMYKVETPFVIIALSLGVLLMSVVMLNGVFSKRVAYIGIGIGAVGVVAGVFGLLVAPLLLSVWYVMVGIQLYKLDESPHHNGATTAASGK
jgi:fatty acid desaturase